MMALRNGTDQLVDRLVLDIRPVPRGIVALRLAVGVTAGAAISMILLISLLGARPDLAIVLQSVRFWSKAGYMVATAGASLLVAARLARPGSSTNIAWIVPLPVLLFLPAVILEMVNTNPSQWAPLLLGSGWELCTWVVLLLSLPIYAGLWWAFRSFAPTDMKMTGAITGLCASAIAAVIYCIHCPSDTAVFALVWYTLAFGIAAALGGAFGRRLLHW
jgi:hypothetical protein